MVPSEKGGTNKRREKGKDEITKKIVQPASLLRHQSSPKKKYANEVHSSNVMHKAAAEEEFFFLLCIKCKQGKTTTINRHDGFP